MRYFSLGLLCFSVLASLTFLSLSVQAAQAEILRETRDWDDYFQQKHAKGVLLLWNEAQQKGITNDIKRAEIGFIPASTFKIPHSLIALDLGVVKDERQVFKWDGQTRDIANWNRDQTLNTAMKYSVVPVYQDFAREIGEPRMGKILGSYHYGNADVSGGIASFWLDGKLRISASEQVRFLRQLYHNKLHASERSQRIVKQAMLTEANSDFIIRAKTGYSGAKQPSIGWWVGWVELDDNVWFFALNIDMPSADALPLRQAITKAVLQHEKVIP